MKTTNCPSCGAPVSFRSGLSILAVCEYCKSTLMRRDQDVENLGRMAELMDDPTLIQLGTEGSYKSVHFAVIGRIQLKYADGLWNEWYLLFDDARSGWLGESGGEFFVTFQKAARDLPSFDSLEPGRDIILDGVSGTVSGLEEAMCIAGAGELPFKVGAGYPVKSADLRAGAAFATIDYSEDPPLYFVGEKVTGASLKFANLRDPRGDAPKKMAVSTFNCPACAAPLAVHSGKIESVGCAGCGSVIDVSNKDLAIISEAQGKLERRLPIPLGSKARLYGVDYEAIGYLRREAVYAGVTHGWDEYLLFNQDKQLFRWLGHSTGHWSVVENVEILPRSSESSAVYKGESFEHFETYEAKVTWVVGEFYWRVKVGDTATVSDYIAPPKIISREKTATEVSWSIGEYADSAALWIAFGLKTPLPPPRGIAPNQPSPYAGMTWRMFKWLFLLMAISTVLHLAISARSSVVYQQSISIDHPGIEQSHASAPFTLAGNGSNLVIRNRTNLANTWASFAYSLVNQDTGQVYRAAQEVAYYYGYDDGESWDEGDRSGDLVLHRVPSGRYVLHTDAEFSNEVSKNSSRRVTAAIEIARGVPSWLNWILLQCLLLLLPLFVLWRSHAFEVARWADSDHPKSTASSGGSDDDDDD